MRVSTNDDLKFRMLYELDFLRIAENSLFFKKSILRRIRRAANDGSKFRMDHKSAFMNRWNLAIEPLES